jgi:hypothetical protein
VRTFLERDLPTPRQSRAESLSSTSMSAVVLGTFNVPRRHLDFLATM